MTETATLSAVAALAALTPWAAVDAAGVDYAVFAQYGVLGVIVVILIIYARSQTQRESARADRLEEKKDELTQDVLNRVIPALEASARAVDESQQIVKALQAQAFQVQQQQQQQFQQPQLLPPQDYERRHPRRGEAET